MSQYNCHLSSQSQSYYQQNGQSQVALGQSFSQQNEFVCPSPRTPRTPRTPQYYNLDNYRPQQQNPPVIAIQQSFTFNSVEKAAIYRNEVGKGIEAVIVNMIKQVVNGQLPSLVQTKIIKGYKNLGVLHPPLTQQTTQQTQVTQKKTKGSKGTPKLPPNSMYVKFGNKSSQRKFTLQIHLMAKIYNMLCRNQPGCTIRDLYYENVSLYGRQDRLEQGLYDLCHVLKVPREGLRVEATSKGLMAGNMRFTTRAGDIINLSHFKDGMLIPSVSTIDDIYHIQSDAKYIIFVEKDAVFQRLISEHIFDVLDPCILVTGKGYPDLVTLKFVRKLQNVLKIRVFALVDSDVYGIEIASVIRWGSYKQASIAKCAGDMTILEELTIPDLVWIGLLPSEILSLALPNTSSSAITNNDQKKLKSLTQRILSQNEPDLVWIHEIETLEKSGVKAEIEALFISPGFATFYLKQKLNAFYKIAQRIDNNNQASTSSSSSVAKRARYC